MTLFEQPLTGVSECVQSSSLVLAISNIVLSVSTLLIGVVIGVTVTYRIHVRIRRNSSSQHEQHLSTNVYPDKPMYEEITTTNLSEQKYIIKLNDAHGPNFNMEENDAYGPI